MGFFDGELFFDRTGKALDYEAWRALFDDAAYRRVSLTTARDGATISTIWLGLNTGDAPPEIFETAISCGDEGERIFDRRATEAEAIALHDRLVAEHGGPAEEQAPTIEAWRNAARKAADDATCPECGTVYQDRRVSATCYRVNFRDAIGAASHCCAACWRAPHEGRP